MGKFGATSPLINCPAHYINDPMESSVLLQHFVVWAMAVYSCIGGKEGVWGGERYMSSGRVDM